MARGVQAAWMARGTWSLAILAAWLTALVPKSEATYRLLSLPELCRRQSPQKPVKIEMEEGGAAVLVLDQGEILKPYWRCDLELSAGKGQGLMVQVEDATLRPNELRPRKCDDYMQLGRDDNTPFFTWDKTDKLCGEEARNVAFDVPNGQLLFWLRLGGMGRTNMLEDVGFSIVVTSYLEKDAPDLTNYRACADGSRFIRRNFFCDGRRNCAMDPIEEEADESQQSCGSGLDLLAPSPPPLSTPHLNLLTITLVLVSAAVLLLALLVLAVRLRRHHSCFHPSSSSSSSSPRGQPELPDRAPNARPAAARPHTLLQSNNSSRVTENLMQQQQHAAPPELHPVRSGGTPDSDSEPPPAYCDLFPVGYTFEEEKTETVVQPQNIEITGQQPLLEEIAHHGEGEPASSTSQEMVPIESACHKPGENVELAETSQNTAFSHLNLE